MATNFMGLNLPTVSTTIGPDWASNLNVAIESIDSHDHTSGKGTKVPAAGLNINTDLNFNNIKAYDLFSTQFTSQPSTLTGATNALSLHVSGGNLYYTNSAGTAVQITSAGAVVSSPNAIQSYELQSVTGNITILAAATPSFFLVDTTASRTITLPLAINVASGRVYKFKDIDGKSDEFPITLAAAGSDVIDGDVSAELKSDEGSWELISNGVDKWYLS